jgi:hypothetical protein
MIKAGVGATGRRALFIGHLDDDFAALARREAGLEGRGCLGERECRVERNAKLASIHESSELDQLRPVRFHYEVRRSPGGSAATETRRPPLASTRAHVRGTRRRPCRRRDRPPRAHPPTVRSGHRQLGALQMHVQPGTHLGRGRDDVGAPPAPEPPRELTDTAHRPVHKYPFAGCETTVGEEPLAGAERRQWEPRRSPRG